ncbi:hypothetical protein O6H91_03G068800 [Diphasiastrum complanatum]|uniref:Uncharacterized protein n=3 Tax=Diphasiastrum complanatum TaxID=34168 RepID=A0ACC2E7Q7_DIPCM|nr:hypothetical protein O6H91_03G068800 [Diphasiastrum complanatum]KAJ7562433.1 hypothetical protein O6H91_03G068800 [Diphasiastrum complanatum]
MGSPDDAAAVDKLYEYGERLNDAKDKAKNESDYVGIIDAAKGSSKAKQLAGQLIPRFFKHFPNLSAQAINAQFDLCEEDELGIRVQAIRGLPLLCKDTPLHLPKVADVLGQLLLAEEVLEKDAVQKALMSVLRQDTKASLTALFKHIETSDENIREKVLIFVREKVFPLKHELLQPQEEMERHITDLIKKSLQDVTGAEFKMFMDFLKSLSLFGEGVPPERVQELLQIVEGQADLDAQFNISDTDHIDRLMSCLYMAVPFFKRGASNSKFLIYINRHILPIFEKLPEDKKLDLLKNLAESSPYASTQDARTLLPSILQLLKKYLPRRRTGEELNFTFVESLLYTFHQLAHKTPNSTNSLCGYKIVTGQPSDRLGEDFTELYKDFTERLTVLEDVAKATMKKLTQGMAEHNKAMAAAKDEAAKTNAKAKKQNTSAGLRTCNNILTLVQPLHEKVPVFIGDKKINLSWKEIPRPAASSAMAATGVKRSGSTTNGAGTAKRGRGDGASAQLVERAFTGPRAGGRVSLERGQRGSWRGARGRGRHFW